MHLTGTFLNLLPPVFQTVAYDSAAQQQKSLFQKVRLILAVHQSHLIGMDTLAVRHVFTSPARGLESIGGRDGASAFPDHICS